MTRALGILICLAGLASLMFCGCAHEQPELTECQERQRDIKFVRYHQGYKNHPPDILCPGDVIDLGR